MCLFVCRRTFLILPRLVKYPSRDEIYKEKVQKIKFTIKLLLFTTITAIKQYVEVLLTCLQLSEATPTRADLKYPILK